MTELNTIWRKIGEINQEIEEIIKSSGYKECMDLKNVKVNYKDSDEIFMSEELYGILERFADIGNIVDYVNSAVQEISPLHKNKLKKYETKKGYVYENGYNIEALITDDYHETAYWTKTRVEHDGKDYYLVGYKGVKLEGLVVRVRKEA